MLKNDAIVIQTMEQTIVLLESKHNACKLFDAC